MGRAKPWTKEEDELLQAAVVVERLADYMREQAYELAASNGHARTGTTVRLKEIRGGWNYLDASQEKARSIAERIGLELLSFKFFRYGAPLLLEKQSLKLLEAAVRRPECAVLYEDVRKLEQEGTE